MRLYSKVFMSIIRTSMKLNSPKTRYFDKLDKSYLSKMTVSN